MKTLLKPFICADLCHLWIVIGLFSLPPASVASQTYPGHRIGIGAGTILLIPDSTTGLTLWATRTIRPGYKPSPDFVGWFSPESVAAWSPRAREFLNGSGAESARLVARDSGGISLIRVEDACCGLAFGHPSEQQRWVIEAGSREILALLDTLDLFARKSRLNPPLDLGYANPTNLRATPDRMVGPSPALRAASGEVWARMTLDRSGAVIPGSESILWATGKHLGDAVLGVLSGYRYHRKDAEAERLMVYQRFRVK